jgi:hypothetical protein
MNDSEEHCSLLFSALGAKKKVLHKEFYTLKVPGCDKMPALLYYAMGLLDFHTTCKNMICHSFKAL